MTDPLRDLERRIDHLESKVDLADQGIRADLAAIRSDIERIKADTIGWVPIIRFLPVERVVYGLVSLVLVAVVTALISLVVRR